MAVVAAWEDQRVVNAEASTTKEQKNSCLQRDAPVIRVMSLFGLACGKPVFKHHKLSVLYTIFWCCLGMISCSVMAISAWPLIFKFDITLTEYLIITVVFMEYIITAWLNLYHWIAKDGFCSFYYKAGDIVNDCQRMGISIELRQTRFYKIIITAVLLFLFIIMIPLCIYSAASRSFLLLYSENGLIATKFPSQSTQGIILFFSCAATILATINTFTSRTLFFCHTTTITNIAASLETHMEHLVSTKELFSTNKLREIRVLHNKLCSLVTCSDSCWNKVLALQIIISIADQFLALYYLSLNLEGIDPSITYTLYFIVISQILTHTVIIWLCHGVMERTTAAREILLKLDLDKEMDYDYLIEVKFYSVML